MKQIVGYILLSLFVCSIFCANYSIVFQSEQIKSEGILALTEGKGFNEAEFSIVNFLDYKHNDHELIIDGKFFEYKILSQNSKTVKLSIRFDEKETKFEKWKHKQHKNPKKQVKKTSLQLYFATIEKTELRSYQISEFIPVGKSFGDLSSFSDLKLNPPQFL